MVLITPYMGVEPKIMGWVVYPPNHLFLHKVFHEMKSTIHFGGFPTIFGNPLYIPITRGCLWVIIPKNPYIRQPYKLYHGYTYVRGTPNRPLKDAIVAHG